MHTIKAILLGVFLTVSCHLIGQNGATLFDPSTIHELRFYFSEEEFWDSLSHNWDEYHDDSGIDIPYLSANLSIDGTTIENVGIRQKGLSSHWSSSEFKKPFKVDLNEFISDQNFDGIKKFNLHNGACDPGMMRDFVGYNIMRNAGVRAPRVSFCKLYLNDEYWGLYSIIEQIDKTFTDANFDNDGTLIKNIGWTELQWEGDSIEIYQEDFQLKTNEDTYDWRSFIQFMDVVNNSSDDEFPAAIQKVFDVDLFLHVLAADIMTNNWDSYIDNKRNFYLYEEPSGKQFHWIPWDYNLSMGGDFPTAGNPFPPFDSSCYIQANFSHVQLDSTFVFTDRTLPNADSWLWDFGDGFTSNQQHPVHTFGNEGKATVCLTAWRNDPNSPSGQICQNKRCQEFDLDFQPGLCKTIQNGTCPFPASDPIFQQVAQQDAYCCEDDWDAFCTLQYFEIQQNPTNYDNIGSPSVPYDLNFQILLDDTSKILAYRLLQVPAFRQRYLDICCLMLAKNFNKERLFPMIDAQRDLIRPHIYDDPNYVFTRDYFEYDLGNGTGGGGGAEIPSLKWVLKKRFDELAENLANTGHDCSQAFSPIGWQDIVINEIMAANSDESGIFDPAGQSDDWIELYNNTNQAVDLKNFYLTDTIGFRLKWTFPFGTVIEPKGYLIVWADKDEDQLGIHTNFKLSAAGEELMLTHEDGTVIDVVSFFQQAENESYARVPNGVGNMGSNYPTFNENNNLTATSQLNDNDNSFNVFPNPAGDFLIVEMSNESVDMPTLNLCNMLGEVLESRTVGLSRIQRFSTAALPNGAYIIESRRGQSAAKKLVLVQH